MYLLTLKKLTSHFTNSLVNVALKFYVVSVTSCNFNFQKQKPRASKSTEFEPVLDKLKHKFRRVEVPFLGHHMEYPRLPHPSYKLERTISHSNLTIHNHCHEEKVLRKFTNEYFK